MKELTVFENEQFGSVRVIEREGEPWFIAADVCRALEIQNTADALLRLDEDEKGVASTYTPGGDQALLIVSEPGLYTLVLGSRKPEAKAFKRWITHEVIPSIRKHGVYATDAVIDQIINNPDYGIRLLEALREERKKNALLQPKADYFDTLVERRTLTGIRETANELGIGQKKFVRFLLNRGYVYRDRKKRLQPYAVHVDDELFVLKEWQKWGPGQGPKRIREAYRRPAAPLLWKSAKLRPPGVKTILTTQSEKRRTRENPCYLGL